MWNSKKSVTLSIIVCFAVIIIIAILLFAMPWLLDFYNMTMRGMKLSVTATEIYKTVLSCFYPSAVFGIFAIICLIKMLFNIKSENIFVMQNVKLLRIISWCCFAVSVITLVGGFFYSPIFILTVAAGFIGLILRIVKNVMQSAIVLREENELTI